MAVILSALCFPGLQSAHAQTNILEDFESYNVASGQYLDPASVAGSGWSRTGAGNPDPQIAKADYDVHCCSSTLPTTNPMGQVVWNHTFDGSEKFLVLRRAQSGLTGELPFRADELTDFTFPVLVDGTLTFQVNPINNSWDGFKFAAHDSGSGRDALTIVFTDVDVIRGDPKLWVGSADFKVRDVNDVLISPEDGINPDCDPNAVPELFECEDRWYEISITFHPNSTFDLVIADIGRTTPNPVSTNENAVGDLLVLTDVPSGVLGVDTFRLYRGTGLGGGAGRPTMIDNIMITRSEGTTVAGAETGTGMEILLPADASSIYQPEVTDDLTSGNWSAFGPQILGDGGTHSVLGSSLGAATRSFRIVVY